MKEIIAKYWDARTKLIKSFRKLNYRLKIICPDNEYKRYEVRKISIMLELRRMDKYLREILAYLDNIDNKYNGNRKVYK